jgi:hypothetical protein
MCDWSDGPRRRDQTEKSHSGTFDGAPMRVDLVHPHCVPTDYCLMSLTPGDAI